MGKKNAKAGPRATRRFREADPRAHGEAHKGDIRYRREGHEADDGDIAELFLMFKAQMDEDARQYEEMCRRNRLNGSKHTKKEPSGTQWVLKKKKKKKRREKEMNKEEEENIIICPIRARKGSGSPPRSRWRSTPRAKAGWWAKPRRNHSTNTLNLRITGAKTA